MIPVSRQKVVPVPVSAPVEVSNSVSGSRVVEVPQPQPHHAVFVSHTSAPVLTVEQLQLQQEPGPALVPGSSSSGSDSNSNGAALTFSSSASSPPQPQPLVSNRVLDRFRNRRTTNNNNDSNSTTLQPETEEPHPLTIHTIVSGPESPSPILATWSTPQHPNPDYLAPYHPSLHKNVHNWSQILLDQLRQKSASSPEELEPPLVAANNSSGEDKGKEFSVQAALSSSVSGIVPAVPVTFEGFSSASIAIASSSDNAGASSPSTAATRRRQQVYVPAPIDKHFLFQTHHREQQAAQQQKPPQLGNGRKHSSRTQSRAESPVPSSSLASLESGAGAGKRIRRRTIRSWKEFVRFFKKLFRSMRSEQQQQQQQHQQQQQQQQTISSSSSAEEHKRRKSKSKAKSKQREGRVEPPVLPPPRITNDACSNNTNTNSNNIAAAAAGQQNHKDKNKDTDDTFNYLVVSDDDDDDDETLDFQNCRREQRRESLTQIVLSAERECEVVARPLSGLTAQPAQPTGGPPPGTSALRAVPKMMKVINRIKANKAQEAVHLPEKLAPTPTPTLTPTPAPVPETVVPTPADITPAVPEVAVPPQKQYFNGARIHPTLLELYEITDHVLGVGTFATVREIRLKSSGQSFALKIILKKTLQGKGSMLDTEISVLSKVRHPNCVSLLEMFETEDAVFLVTDLAEGGELFEQLLQKGCYTEGDAARLVREILLGVEYLHSMEIVHRDLKPENLLFLDKSENARLLITDFGLSKVLTSGEDVLMTACGTPGYVAPEVLEQIGHGKPVDMWSLGVIAYTLLCGYTPFWGDDQQALFENIIAGQYQFEEEYWRDISPLAKNFINTLLVRPAEIRSTATQALAHPWFRAVLDQDLSAPASPQDSVNLLPAVRKNFNARTVFKKAVRAVGILRRMQAAPPSQQREQQRQREAQSPPAGPANIINPLDTSTAAGALSSGTMVQEDSGYTLPSPPPPNNSFAHPHQAELVVTVNGTAGRNQAQQLEQERLYFKENHVNNWSFHDVVTAAMITNGQGLGSAGGDGDGGEGEEGSGGKEAVRNDSEDQLRLVSDVLEDLSATRAP
ncbi:hypothetical protein KI688_011145 [Linnemannia hyalina]|uniref:Protein kinase domain-containing protein n=1 Tax=Linnemannia hyalina TaxID=64524 RepID=A0A9P8BV35_9FUNG|nr:hypothetical protein KI688_011145 [Linnemannia hyalina]